MNNQEYKTSVEKLAATTIRFRWLVIVLTLLFVGFSISRLATDGVKFDTSYRIFFSEDNPHLQAFDQLQNVYTKDDNVMYVLTADKETIYEKEFLEAVKWLTTESWQLPYSRRVDSITNFQNSVAVEDDLFVADLVPYDAALDDAELASIRDTALAEPALFNRLINDRDFTTGVNVTVTLPGLDDMTEVPLVVTDAKALKAKFLELYPDIQINMAGMVMMNNAFAESSQSDMSTVMMYMFLAIFIIMAVLLRSIFATIATGLVIIFTIMSSMGIMVWYGYHMSPPLASAPTMIMTLAIADSIHILITFFHELRHGRSKREAIIESVRVNFMPVFLTTITTAIGFLSMNFSDAPPFRQLGNVVASGVVIAWMLSVFFLPAVLSIFPFKPKEKAETKTNVFDSMVDFLSAKRVPVLVGSILVVVFMGLMIPRIDLNDQWVKYFDERMEFRQDADYAEENLTGMNNFEFSLPAAESGGINEPEYLQVLEDFSNWYRNKNDVVQVNSIVDVMKRLNKNMHGDDSSYYRIPDTRDLAAQYLLLYEFSLPYGLDLNNQINIDKSATRFTVTTKDVATKELRQLILDGEQWLLENAPDYMQVKAASPTVMFAYISERNIKSMMGGTFIAIIAISIILGVALKTFKYGILSLVPNLVPAILGFGFWSILYGEMGLSLAMVSGMTLGIVVDDTVHFLSKYLRARREKGYSSEQAVRYAFQTVGKALVVTTVILVVGFGILGTSTFRMNSWMGQLTAIVIVLALIADFILLPTLLMVLDGKSKKDLLVEEKEIEDKPAMA
ncbi:efflux RND transporter permease subunit [Puniceicoccaceae bacterium K14]|nr:efflux RND transporter permease subunit [Puniceicoccaceae bacterium K14]